MRCLKDNNVGSIVPLAMYILTLIGAGALYTLFFLEVALPELSYMIPAGDAKTYILMVIYAIPLIVTIILTMALLLSGLKRQQFYYNQGGGF